MNFIKISQIFKNKILPKYLPESFNNYKRSKNLFDKSRLAIVMERTWRVPGGLSGGCGALIGRVEKQSCSARPFLRI